MFLTSSVFASIDIIFDAKKTNLLLSAKNSNSKFQSKVKHGKSSKIHVVFVGNSILFLLCPPTSSFVLLPVHQRLIWSV